MAAVEYLKGGERPTAALMNALFGEFDRRLSALLAGGKTPLLAQAGQLPPRLFGKVFYFTTGDDHTYAPRIPGGPLSTVQHLPFGAPTTKAWSYNHSVFTNYIAGLNLSSTSITWDDAHRICILPQVPASAWLIDAASNTYYPADLWNGQPVTGYGMGFFENSLSAHYVMHQGPADTEPQKYYLQDGPNGGSVGHWASPPEKRLHWAAAEIVVEGPASVTLQREWDKYSFFRIHNCNPSALTVNFPDWDPLTVPAYSCATVRRDPAAEAPGTGQLTYGNYRKGWNYFWKFEPGDPRCFWFLPTTIDLNLVGKPVIGTGPRAANAQAANNLTNPAVLLDWVEALSIDEDTLGLREAYASSITRGMVPPLGNSESGSAVYARFIRDRSILYDASPLNKNKFGDPSDANTLLGDLLHHRGEFIIVRTSKAQVDPATRLPLITFETAQFNGYATIVTDFAAHQLTVAENANGDLSITNSDPNNWVDLLPVSTNLFKSGEAMPNVVPLNNWSYYGSSPFTIENAVLETNPDAPDPALGAAGPLRVWQRALQTTANTKQYYAIGASYGQETTVSGDPNMAVIGVNPSGGGQKVMHGIHKVKVSDLLSLVYWGNQNLANQSTPYGTYSNQKLTLTNEGLVLTYDETITGIAPNVLDSNMAAIGDYYPWLSGQLTRHRIIRFRGHGWGYVSGSVGSWASAFFSARYPARGTKQSYSGEVIPKSPAADFDWPHEGLRSYASRIGWLRRVKHTEMVQNAGVGQCGRFWKSLIPGLNTMLKNLSPAAYRPWRLNNGASQATETACLPLLPEHYNGLARAVNSLKRGYALTATALVWRCKDGTPVSLVPQDEGIPVPMNAYMIFGGESPLYKFCQDYHIPIKDFRSGNYDLSRYHDVVSLCGAAISVAVETGLVAGVGGFHDGTWNGQPTRYGNTTITGNISLALTIPGAGNGVGVGSIPTDPTGDAIGSYMSVSGSGYLVNDWGAWLYVKGDLLVAENVFGLGKYYNWYNRQRWNPAAAYLNYTGGVVQLFPDGAGTCAVGQSYNYVYCNASLGTWNNDDSYGVPAPLTSDYADVGKFWEVGHTNAWFRKGSRMVWDGSQWQNAASSYDDMYWVDVDDVKAFMEASGFLFAYNEYVIPLELRLLTNFGGQAPPGTQPSAAVNLQFNDFPRVAGNEANAQKAMDTVPILAPNGDGAGLRVNIWGSWPGAQELRFCHKTDQANAKWKLRMSQLQSNSGYSSAFTIADVKSWVGDGPPVVVTDSYVASGFPSYWTGAAEWYDPSDYAGSDVQLLGTFIYDGYPNHIAAPAWDLGFAGSGGGWNSGTLNSVWDGLVFTGRDIEHWCMSPGVNGDGNLYQFCTLGVLQCNSAGLAGAQTIMACPVGWWRRDGDFWATGSAAFAWSAGGGIGWNYWNTPAIWQAATTAQRTVSPQNGLTLIAAQAGEVALILTQTNCNLIDLAGTAPTGP